MNGSNRLLESYQTHGGIHSGWHTDWLHLRIYFESVCGAELSCKLQMWVCLHSPRLFVRANALLTKLPSSWLQLHCANNNNPVSCSCDVKQRAACIHGNETRHIHAATVQKNVQVGSKSLSFPSEIPCCNSAVFCPHTCCPHILMEVPSGIFFGLLVSLSGLF